MVDKPKARGSSRHRYWVVAQHHQVEIVEADERPDTTVEAGERMKKAKGPYATKEAAQAERDRMRGATLAVWVGRESI